MFFVELLSSWLSVHTKPLAPTHSLSSLSQEEMTSALATMRVDYDQVKIKDLDTSSNPLLNKRRKKAAAGAKSGSTVCQSQWDSVDGWLKCCWQLRTAAQPRVRRDDLCTTCFKELSSKIKRRRGTTAESELDICHITWRDITCFFCRQ